MLVQGQDPKLGSLAHGGGGTVVFGTTSLNVITLSDEVAMRYHGYAEMSMLCITMVTEKS